jgi:hypothetical protein
MLKISISSIAQKLYLALCSIVFINLVIPWGSLDEQAVRYSFLPHKILTALLIFIWIAIVATEKKLLEKYIPFMIAVLMTLLHYKFRGTLETHYIIQIFYLEISYTLLTFPHSVLNKCNLFIAPLLVILLMKAPFFRIGPMIHGGFLSSNLYATYIFYITIPIIYFNRYLLAAASAIAIFYIGSKAVYLSSLSFIILFASKKFVERKIPSLKESQMGIFPTIIISVLITTVMTFFTINTSQYLNFRERLETSRREITDITLMRYNLIFDDLYRERVLESFLEKRKGLEEKSFSFTSPLISDPKASLFLRISQYQYVLLNLKKFLFIGDELTVRENAYGHNPHNAILDLISRFGILFTFFIFYYYRKLFFLMKNRLLNLCLLPIIIFQPYSFTLGFSLIILCFIYNYARNKYDITPQ